MDKKKCIITIMGRFDKYECVDYIYNKKHIKTDSSVIAMASEMKPYAIIAVVPLSLSVTCDLNEIQNYNIDHIKTCMENKADNFFKNNSVKIDDNETTIISVVLTNTGKFKIEDNKKSQQSSDAAKTYMDQLEISTDSKNQSRTPSIFYGGLYIQMYKLFSEIGNSDVYLDITHSMNSLVVDAVDAVNLALKTLSAEKDIKFKFFIMHSDPFVKGLDTPLEINEYTRYTFNDREKTIAEALSDFVYNFDTNIYKSAISELKLSIDAKSIKKYAYYLINGAILLATSNNSEMGKWKNALENRLCDNMLPEQGNINNSENKISIKMQYSMLREIAKLHSALSIMTCQDFNFGNSPSVPDLKKAVKLIPEPGSTLLSNELNKMENITNIKQDWTKLCLCYDENKPPSNKCDFNNNKPPSNKCDFNKRNFIAHAGMEQNITYLKKDHDKILVSYQEECLKCIMKKLGDK
jgi:CRISPR-associated protein Csx1